MRWASGSAATGDEPLSSAPTPDDTARAFGRVFDGIDTLGPGSPATRRAIVERLRLLLPAAPDLADLGCGAGAASLDLAALLPAARIVAIDTNQAFLDRLAARAAAAGAGITTLNADMAAPGLADASLDLVWCESAIYAVGRHTALAAWRPLLRPHGRIAFSDVVWRVPDPPAEARRFWADEYPAMTTTDGVRDEIKAAGYAADFIQPAPIGDWQAYYAPLRRRLVELGETATGALADVIAAMREEIAVFDRYGECYASVWFVVHRAE